MLYNILFYLFICVITSNVCLCERRITNGKVVTTEKKYMVYLVNSQYSDNQPENWLCGGVLISTLHVLTAAACLTEVSHMYVIAGYKKYVSGKNIVDDPCASTRKQRIVKVIIPKAYNESSWMQFDVGVGVVEKHYDFLDDSYREYCSYSPEAITINYDTTLESAGDSVVALGWGAANPRLPGMSAINSEYLMETHAIIGDSSFCQQQFPKNVEYLFLCTYGYRDVETLKAIHRIKKEREMTSSSTTKRTTARFSISSKTTKTTTTRARTKLRLAIKRTRTTKTATMATTFTYGTWRCGNKQFTNTPDPECLDMVSDVEVLRRKALILDGSDTSSEKISDKNETFNGNKSDSNHTISRRKGTDVENYGSICQNDHGGPLVALSGQQEKLIGIALNSVYNKNYKCDGPSLYLSTTRAKALIRCLLAPQTEKYYVDCETTTVATQPKPSVRSVSVPWKQPGLSTPKVQPKTKLSTTLNPKQTSTHYAIGLPSLYASPNLMMGVPYIPPNHNVPLQYKYNTPPNFKMPLHYTYFTPPRYNMGLPYKIQNYHMGMPHIASNLNMGIAHIPSNLGSPYNPSNYFKGFPYNLQSYNTAKKSPYAWS